MVRIQPPTRDASGNISTSADFETRWGPVSIALRFPRRAIEAGALPYLVRNVSYGAEALGEHIATSGHVGQAETLAEYNAERLRDVHANPNAPLSHAIMFEGAPVVLDEACHAVARFPNDPRSVSAVQYAMGMASSEDPAQQSFGAAELQRLRACCILRQALANPAAHVAIVRASANRDDAAVALRQAITATKLADARDAARTLAEQVQSGDRQAHGRAMALLRLAGRGDALACHAATVFATARASIPFYPYAVPPPPEVPENLYKDPETVGTISSSDGGVGCGCKGAR